MVKSESSLITAFMIAAFILIAIILRAVVIRTGKGEETHGYHGTFFDACIEKGFIMRRYATWKKVHKNRREPIMVWRRLMIVKDKHKETLKPTSFSVPEGCKN